MSELNKYFKNYGVNPAVFQRVIAIEDNKEVFKGVLFHQGKIGAVKNGYQPYFIECTHEDFQRVYKKQTTKQYNN